LLTKFYIKDTVFFFKFYEVESEHKGNAKRLTKFYVQNIVFFHFYEV